MRESFEILEHTADIGFRARGRTREQMFENAALALESIVLEMDAVQPRKAYAIAAAGEDEESLLVNWLNEVLFFLDGRRVAMSRFRIEEATPLQVSGRAWGEPRDPDRHRPRLVVKGVTYHQLKITRDGNGWCAEVYLDI